MNKIDYDIAPLRTIEAVNKNVRIYDATTGKFETKDVTRFNNDIQIHGYQYTTADEKVHTVSMSQLFMTICMNRANDIEAETVTLMAKMSENTTKLTELADLEDIALNDTQTEVTRYAVKNSFDFCKTYAVETTILAAEANLTVPTSLQNALYSGEGLPLEKLEEYHSFLSQIIEVNRGYCKNNTWPSGSRFKEGIYQFYSEKFHISFPGISNGNFNYLFGDNQAEYATSIFYRDSSTTHPEKETVKCYKVGEHTFTKEQMIEYASKTYGIDMKKSTSEVTSAIESKMDEYNAISQEDMIELQSLVSKRDQSYTLISNALKNMYNSNLSAANNLK